MSEKMSKKFLHFSCGARKRGISAIVATVLIILITVAAVTIVWAAIIPMIDNQLSKGTLCLDAISQLSLKNEGYTCKNADGISLQVKRGAKAFDLVDIQVLVSNAGDTVSYTILNDAEDSTGNPITINGLPGANEERVFIIDMASTTDVSDVQIAPVVAVGNSEEICDVSDIKVLLDC